MLSNLRVQKKSDNYIESKIRMKPWTTVKRLLKGKEAKRLRVSTLAIAKLGKSDHFMGSKIDKSNIAFALLCYDGIMSSSQLTHNGKIMISIFLNKFFLFRLNNVFVPLTNLTQKETKLVLFFLLSKLSFPKQSRDFVLYF